MINRLLSFLRAKAFDQPSDLALPRDKRVDDIFLVSFPKSGNTWISFVLANIMVEKLGLDLEVNNFNIHGFIPDIHMGREIPLDMGFFPFKRVIKSHSDFNRGYINVIYLLRDPRAVMVSYHKHVRGLRRFDGDISDLIRNDSLGISAWAKHVSGWFDNVEPCVSFRFFRYEDFKTNPGENTRSMARLLGVSLVDEELAKVLENSSFERMRMLEEQIKSVSWTKGDKDFKFVREGRTDGWRSELGENDLSYIMEKAGTLMKKFGYE
ncbi:MAG: sulfotransferase domain-containing protein [Acidobacteriota bacterium]|jgi:hypothetical protein